MKILITGGLNLRGYSGYVVPKIEDDGTLTKAYKGTSGSAFNTEIEFQELFKGALKFMRKSPGMNKMFNDVNSTIGISTYLFGDIGIINSNPPGEDPEFIDFRADAGAGAALTIKRWGPLQLVKPLTIRFDVPAFVNRVPAVEEDYLKFRWIVGVSRAF